MNYASLGLDVVLALKDAIEASGGIVRVPNQTQSGADLFVVEDGVEIGVEVKRKHPGIQATGKKPWAVSSVRPIQYLTVVIRLLPPDGPGRWLVVPAHEIVHIASLVHTPDGSSYLKLRLSLCGLYRDFWFQPDQLRAAIRAAYNAAKGHPYARLMQDLSSRYLALNQEYNQLVQAIAPGNTIMFPLDLGLKDQEPTA